MIDASLEIGFSLHPTGTCVAIEGPRFSSRAEVGFFTMISGRSLDKAAYITIIYILCIHLTIRFSKKKKKKEKRFNTSETIFVEVKECSNQTNLLSNRNIDL